eukprot:9467191-Pyramimonas_sp.AAC.1
MLFPSYLRTACQKYFRAPTKVSKECRNSVETVSGVCLPGPGTLEHHNPCAGFVSKSWPERTTGEVRGVAVWVPLGSPKRSRGP